MEAQHRWWKRVQPMGDWEENVFQQKILSLQRERTPCGQARRIQWSGAVDFPRVNPMIQTQTADSTVGSGCTLVSEMGFCKTQKSYLDPQDDAMIEMRRQRQERRREKDGRLSPSHCTEHDKRCDGSKQLFDARKRHYWERHHVLKAHHHKPELRSWKE